MMTIADANNIAIHNVWEGIFSGIGGIAEMAELAEISVSNNSGALYLSGRKTMQLGIMYFVDSRIGTHRLTD